jgi:hypothetical protein
MFPEARLIALMITSNESGNVSVTFAQEVALRVEA